MPFSQAECADKLLHKVMVDILGLVMRKPVFGLSDWVQHKLG